MEQTSIYWGRKRLQNVMQITDEHACKSVKLMQFCRTKELFLKQIQIEVDVILNTKDLEEGE